MTRAKSRTIEKILHEYNLVGDTTYGLSYKETQELLKEIQDLIVESLPSYEEKTSRKYFSPNINGIKAHRSGYMLGVRDTKANLLKILGGTK